MGVAIGTIHVGIIARQLRLLRRLVGAIGNLAGAGGFLSGVLAQPDTSARGIFPLGFGEQAIGLPGEPRQPFDIGFRIRPVDADRRVVAALGIARIAERAIGALLRRVVFE